MSNQSSPACTGRFRAFLFDMDGTIINSVAAAERIWSAWAVLHNIEVASFLKTIHGVRAIDTITRLALPDVDAEKQAQIITQNEIDDVNGIVEIPGSIQFLKSLPATQWAIVTSAPKQLALRRLQAAGMPLPEVMVTADDVSVGKPDPSCFILAAKRLGVDIADCLIFEDAPAGIQAAEAASGKVVVVTTTHTHPITTSHATINSYEHWMASCDENGLLALVPRK